MCEVEIYNLIGNGRSCPSYQPTAVYKGRLKDSIEFVAIKLIDMQRQDEIVNAVDLLKNLQHHDNIVDFIDCAENYNSGDSKNNSGKINFNSSINSRNRGQTNQIRLVVEYCPGGTLMELLERDVSLPESVIQIFASDILSAFLHLHKNGIIYRDISPRNILLDECGLIKLGDFCRSGRIGESVDFSVIDPEMLQYMSPELLDEDPCPSFSSDFYALGCIMYQMATGHSPFPIPLTDDGQDIDEMKLIGMIRDYHPVSQNNPIPDVSKEFNDLLIKLLDKDPYKRPNWLELVTHPFWKDTLTTDRLDNAFDDFKKTYQSLPKEIRFEKKRQQTKLSTPSSTKTQSSTANNFNRSSLVRSSLKSLADKSPEPKEQKSPTENNDHDSPSLSTYTPSIRDLILRSSLFQTSQLSVNINIMNDDLPSFEGISLPFQPNSLRSSDVEDVDKAVSKLNSIFNEQDKANAKGPILSFLITQSKSPEIAENLSNSMLLSQLPLFANDAKNNQLKSLFLMLFGSLISNSTIIYKSYIKEDKVELIEKLCSFQNEIVMAKAVACIGELISFVARTNENSKANEGKKNSGAFTVSQNSKQIIVNGLASKSDIVKHICLKTVTNVLLSSKFNEFFDPSIIEASLSKFGKSNNMSIVDSFAICSALFFIKNKATSLDFPSSSARKLIATSPNDSVICQQMGIIIAAATNTLLAMREPILDIFLRSQNPNLSQSKLLANSGLLYEAKVKSFLSFPIIYKDHQLEFVDISARFFSMLEKYEYNDEVSNLNGTLNSTQNTFVTAHSSDLSESLNMNDISDAITAWAVSFCESAVDSVVVGADFDLLQIVYNGIQIKSFAQRIWTSKFEKKIRKIVRNTTFNSNKSEIAIQLIQCALCYNLCDISIITDLCRALNSQLENIRFTVVKLVADATSLKDQSIIEFVENNIINQLMSLLQDQSLIADQTLRILSNSADMKPAILKNIVKPQTISLILSRISDNSSAFCLAKKIIESGYVPIDVLISARLVPAILSTMEKRDQKEKGNSKISASPSVKEQKRIGSSLSNQSIPEALSPEQPSPAAVENALSLLLVTLKMIEQKLTEVKGNQARRNLIKSINTLASLTPKTAVLLLEHPETAGKCFCSLVKIFEPQGTQNEVLIDSSLHPFSISLSQGCRKQENVPILIEALKTLQWAAENSSAVRLRLKGAGTLMSAIKKAADYGATDELKTVAVNCQKVIKG